MTRLDDNQEDVFVQLVDFKDIPGEEMVTINEDGTYTILLNARMSYERQVEALNHAIHHIDNDDFSKSDVQEIEAEAHHIIERRQQQDRDKARLERRKKRMERRRRKALRELRKKNEETVRRLAEYQDFVTEMERDHPGLLEARAWDRYNRIGGI